MAAFPEQQPQRWMEKYGTTHRLISVHGRMVTISSPVESDQDEDPSENITLLLSKEAGITPEELRKEVGYYMKFSRDYQEISGVAELDDSEENTL